MMKATVYVGASGAPFPVTPPFRKGFVTYQFFVYFWGE